MTEPASSSDLHHHEAQASGSNFPLMARYAGFIAWPISHFHPTHLQDIDHALTLLAGHREFSRPLEAATLAAFEPGRFGLDDEAMAAIATQREAQIALLVTTASPEEFERAANFLAAAILQRHLSTLLARKDRERAIGQLGSSAFQLGIREAHALYAGLERLAPPALPADDGDDDRALTEFGESWLHRFVADAVPALAPVLALRRPRDATLGAERFDPAGLTLAANLLRRKIPGWLQCTV